MKAPPRRRGPARGATPRPGPGTDRTGERVGTDPRISRRRQAVARSKRRRFIATMTFLASVAALVWIAFWSPLLTVDKIQVVGERNSSATEVRAATGLGPEDNLLLVSTGEVVAKVKELPWVRDAKVDRRLPGTVRVRVFERRPAMVLSLSSGRWTIDSMGRVLDSGASSKALPSLSGPEVSALQPGDELSAPELTGALKVWRKLPKGLRARVAAIFAPTVERITLVLDDQTTVRYGAPEHLAGKNSVLTALLKSLAADGQRVTYIDVRVPTNPAVGPPLTTAVAPAPPE